jgi:hypothetical protein
MNFLIILGIVAVWLLGLTIFVILQTRFFNRLTKDEKGKGLKSVLERILKEQKESTKDISALEKELAVYKEEGKLHVQKVGLVRFNPFKELGGDHSFSLAILDGKDTGVIVTGLHTRERTRVYAKEVKNGKSQIELSKEEKQALDKALKS